MSLPLASVLIAYLLARTTELTLTLVNLNHLRRHGHIIPPIFAGMIDSERLTRTRDYTVEKGFAGLAESLLHILITLGFLFGPVLNWYNNRIFAIGLCGVVEAVLFFLLLFYAETVIKIPFDLYRTFRIEVRYGFNTQTLGLWLTDTVKGLVLATVIGIIVIGGVFGLIAATPRFWWLTAWLFLLAVNILILYLAPALIEPLFNTFTPIADPALEQRLKEVLARAGLVISRVFTMDASKRSKHSNAYFSGIGRVKRIVLFDTLLAANSQEEIVAILAHEAGHWKKKHLLKRLVLVQALSLAGFFIAHRLIQNYTVATLFGLDEPTLYGQLLLVGFLASLAGFPFTPLMSHLSRCHEREADRFAVDLTGSGAPLAEALIKLGRDNLANLHPHPWYAAFHYSHPPLTERVTTLRHASTP